MLLGLLIYAASCEPWLIAQVERARQRVSAAPIALECPEPGVVIVDMARPGQRVQLTGFTEGDAWVGTALVSLVEVRRADRERLPIVPPPGPIDVVATAAPPAAGPRALRFIVRPAVTVLFGSTPQASIGAEALASIGPLRFGALGARHAATAATGALYATDLLATLSVPIAVAPIFHLEPGIAAGAAYLEGASATKATAASSFAPALRAWLDAGFDLAALGGALSLSAGVRVGLRVAPAGRADGVDVLAGTAAQVGGFFGVEVAP